MKDTYSKTNNVITSRTDCTIKITSQTNLDIQSKTESDIESIYQDPEKEAFLYTAKHNAALMFAKYL